MAFTKILVACCLFVAVTAVQVPKRESDLKADNSYGLGYTLGYSGLGYGGLGYGLGHSYYPSHYSGYGGYGGYGLYGGYGDYSYPKYYSYGYSWPYSGYYGHYY